MELKLDNIFIRLAIKCGINLGAHLRYAPIFFFLRILYRFDITRNFVYFWDPNIIRKNKDIVLKEKIYFFLYEGCTLKINLNDHIGFISYVRNEPFEMAVYNIADKLGLSKNDVILDIGANIGTASIPICYKNKCELWAFEASKGNADYLMKNIYNNRIKSKVFINALVNESCQDNYLNLYIREGNTGSNSIMKNWNPSINDVVPETVPTAKLDEVIKINDISNVSLIKIDVEGAEYEVLSGGKVLLSKTLAPIIMEYRLDNVSKFLNGNYSDLIKMVSGNFIIHSLDDNYRLSTFDPEISYENILLIPKENYNYLVGRLS